MPALNIDIEARYAKFQDALNNIERSTKKTAASMSGAFGEVQDVFASLGAVLTVGGFAVLIKNAIDAADNLRDLSQETGIAVENLGGLGFAAGQAGGNLESIASAAGKLNKSIAEAAGGNRQFADVFKALNIDIRDAAGNLKSVDKVMVELADKFASYADGPEKVRIATKLMSKAGAEQIPLLNEGGKALQANIEYYKRYSGITQETADKADAFNDTMAKLSFQAGAFGRTLAAELLPSLQGTSQAILDISEKGNGFNVWAERAASLIKLLGTAALITAHGMETMGINFGAAAAKGAALSKLDFKAFKIIEEGQAEDLQKAAEANQKLRQGLNGTMPTDAVSNFLSKYAGQIKAEEDVLRSRNDMLAKYNNENLISDKDFASKKVAAQREASANIKAIYEVQILNVKNAIEKGVGDATQLRSILDDLAKKQSQVGGPGKKRAPIIGSDDAKGAARGKVIDVGYKEFERQLEAEQRLLASRSDFLQNYYQADLLSITDYYSGKRAAQEEALSAQLALIDKEVAALEARKPKDEREASDNTNKVNDLTSKRAALAQKAGEDGIKLQLEQDRAAKAFQSTLAGINAELLEQQGLLPQAAASRFDQANAQLKQKLETSRDNATVRKDFGVADEASGALEKLNTLRNLSIAQARLNNLGDIGANVQATLSEATERAQIAASTGASTELESLRMVSDARLQAVADLQQVADAFSKVANASADPRMQQQARAMQLEVEKLAASADLVREKFEDAFSGSFETALDKLISGTSSLKDVVKGLFSDISAEISKIITRNLTQQLFSKNGSLGGLVDFAGSLFGGQPAQTSPSTSVATGVAGAVGAVAGGGAEAAAATAATAALSTLATATATVDAAMLTLGNVALPIANTQVSSLGTTSLIADQFINNLSSSAAAAALALDAIATKGAGQAAGGIAALFASANGHVFSGGNVIQFAKGGIPDMVSTPTFFPMKGGRTGLMGEAGPEAIMPLKRGTGGQLSVTMLDEKGRASLLPVTRDAMGRMAVRAQAFAKGGVVGADAGRMTMASRQVMGMGGEVVEAGGSNTVHLNVHVTPPSGSSTQSAQQWGATAGRQISNAMRRNG